MFTMINSCYVTRNKNGRAGGDAGGRDAGGDAGGRDAGRAGGDAGRASVSGPSFYLTVPCSE